MGDPRASIRAVGIVLAGPQRPQFPERDRERDQKPDQGFSGDKDLFGAHRRCLEVTARSLAGEASRDRQDRTAGKWSWA